VDWDYFFHDKLGEEGPDFLLYDWSHKETPFYTNSLWEIRASNFLRYGLKLPQTTGEERSFWAHFKFSKKAELYYAESHSFAALPSISQGVTEVWSFDAHHDTGYGKELPLGRITCENWFSYYRSLGADRLHLRYPRWKSLAMVEEPSIPLDRNFADLSEVKGIVFRRIFICRSGAWVPSWLDAGFEGFIKSCPVRKKTCLERGEMLSPRKFDLGAAKKMAQPLEFLH